MLKDIRQIVVEDVVVAIVPKDEPGEEGETLWDVYILNLKEKPIENVIVASHGYGQYKGEDVKTSTLRHYLGEVTPKQAVLIEPIHDRVFGLNNEYWVSFYMGMEVYDKKYIFLPETIKEEFFTNIPLLDKRGVMIR